MIVDVGVPYWATNQRGELLEGKDGAVLHEGGR